MLNGKWFEGPDWLLNEEEWPEQLELKSSPKILEEQRPIEEPILCAQVIERDEWDDLLEGKPYWAALRTAAWSLRFMKNCQKKIGKGECDQRSFDY